MVNSGKGSPPQNTSTSRRATPHSAPPEAPLQVVLTLAPLTHEVIKIERLGTAGERFEVSEQEYGELAGEEEFAQFVGAVQEAYEAGIADGLSQEIDVDEDSALCELLVGSADANRMVRRHLRGALLRRMLLRRLLRRHIGRPQTGSPQTDEQQRRKPLERHAQNGSASRT
jgi:hypothetical protein